MLQVTWAKASVVEWSHAHGHVPQSSQKGGGYYDSKGGQNLLWEVQQANIGVMGQLSQ